MPDPHTIPFREADGNGHYRSKQLPEDKADFLEGLGLPEFAGDVVSASNSTVGGEVTTFWGTDGHTIKATNLTGLAKMTSGVLSAVSAPVGEVVGTTDVQTLTNKTIDSPVVIGSVSGLDKYDVGLGNVDNTSDANKPISNPTQAALDIKEDKPNKGIANGYAGLDTIGKVPLAQLPDAIIGASRYQGTWNAAINNPTIPPAIPGNSGYYYSVSTAGSTNIDGISTWAVGDTIISNGTIWQKIPVANAVQSVNGKQGIVVVNKADVGLGNVDNTSDATKNSAGATLTNKIISGANNTLTVRLNTADVTGSLPVTNLDGGTAASSTTFWRGDGHWVSPTGAGDVQGPGSSTDGAVALYNGATGKQLKVFAGAAGFGKLDANGVVSTQAQIQAPDLSAAAISGQTEKTVAVDPEDMFLEVDKVSGALRYVRAKWFSRLGKGTLGGLTLANGTDATNDIDVAVGECRDDANGGDIVLGTVLTKQLDAVWAAGTAAGGRDTGAIADGTWHVYAIRNPTTGVADVLFSLSVSAPTMPSGFTQKRRIGSVIRATAAIKLFRQFGDYFMWQAAALDINDSQFGSSGSGFLHTLSSVPSGASFNVQVAFRAYHTGGAMGVLIRSTLQTQGDFSLFTPSTNNNASMMCSVWTDTARQIYIQNATSPAGVGHVYGNTLGYWDPRGKQD